MTSVVIRLDVPEKCQKNFPHELELLRDFMGPLIGWLESHGGGMRVEAQSPAGADVRR